MALAMNRSDTTVKPTLKCSWIRGRRGPRVPSLNPARKIHQQRQAREIISFLAATLGGGLVPRPSGRTCEPEGTGTNSMFSVANPFTVDEDGCRRELIVAFSMLMRFAFCDVAGRHHGILRSNISSRWRCGGKAVVGIQMTCLTQTNLRVGRERPASVL